MTDFSFNYKNNKNEPFIDYTNPAAILELNKSILKSKYNIIWDIPLNHLLPPITNRENYIIWINHLMKIQKFNNKIIGIDMYGVIIYISGTGASCIIFVLKKVSIHSLDMEGTLGAF